MRAVLNRPVTVIRRYEDETTDRYGNPLPLEEITDTVGNLQQRTREEPAAAGEFSVTDWLLFLPAGTQLDTGDAVQVDGAVYELTGEPWHVRNDANGRESHVEVSLRRAGSAEEDEESSS